jgi:hypothetical protein
MEATLPAVEQPDAFLEPGARVDSDRRPKPDQASAVAANDQVGERVLARTFLRPGELARRREVLVV